MRAVSCSNNMAGNMPPYSRVQQLLMVALVLLGLLITESQGAISITTDNGQILGNTVTVGNGSDVLIQVSCDDTADSGDTSYGFWSFNNGLTAVPQPLTAFGISQGSGVLRIYPAPLAQLNDSFTCTIDGVNRSVTFILLESLFFTEPLPSFLRVNDTPTLNCTTPDIPASNLTSSKVSCSVWSDRGSFHRLVPILSIEEIPDPEFVVQPSNTTATLNGSAAFACIVSPAETDSYSLVSITWMFQSEIFGSGMLDNETELETVTVSNGVTDGFPYTGTSILKIENVDMSDGGQYFCVAQYSDGRNITSEMATLQINETAFPSTFLLTPPTMFTITEGDALTLPCVLPANQSANWTLEGQAVSNTSGIGTVFLTPSTISIVDVDRTAQGTLSCSTVGGENATIDLNVLASLRFDSTPFNETIHSEGDDVTLECIASGNPVPEIKWFRNNTEITQGVISTEDGRSSLSIPRVQPNDTAIYQCVAMTTDESISSYTYLIVEFINEAVVSPGELLVNPVDQVDFTLNCTIGSHPLVEIEWEVGRGVASTPRQLPVGFRGPSVSELVLNSGNLSGQHLFNCSAQLNQVVQTATVTVNAFSPVTITTSPEDTPPVLTNSTVSFLCQAQSIPAPVITWFRNGAEAVTESDSVVSIRSSSTAGDTTTSNLTINGVREGDFGNYSCVADNGFFNATSDMATLVRGVEASIIQNPEPETVIRVAGEEVSFTCRARGFPLPDITWTVTGVSPPSTGIIDSMTVSSSITFEPTINNTMVVCRAENMFNSAESEAAEVLLAGPPLSPNISINPEARRATVTWDTPFSLIPITDYRVTLLNAVTNVAITMDTVNVTMATIGEPHLVPFTDYRVSVIARNRAGASSPGRMAFTTAEAAPTATPTNVVTSAVVLGEIFVTWSPPPEADHNGIIRSYGIYYSDVTSPVVSVVTVGEDVLNKTLMRVTPGATYNVSVFATTVADGPNATVTQNTISEPPDIDGEAPSLSALSGTTSFPITIPFYSSTAAAVIWVVVIKVSSSFDVSISPDTVYPNNDSFVFASIDSIPVDRPYIAAEISTSNADITFPYTFQIGDEALTSSVNEYDLYSNPPLTSSTSYTAFLRVFPPAVSDGSRAKRQATNAPQTQYTVFTSTRFLPIVQTASPSQGLDGGSIAGIVIAVLLLIAIIAVLGVVGFFLWRTSRHYSHNLPPPSRKGSMRLTESQRLLNTPLPVVRHNKMEEIVTISKNVRGASDGGPLSPLTPPDERIPILRSNFSDHVRQLHSNSDHLFAEEYELIGIKSANLAHQASQLPWNQAKNRYANINSFDKTRVLLNDIPGVEGADYINANYISGYKDNVYIAAQGPLSETTQDFWRMVWEQRSACIVMLTNTIEKGRTKCHQYWPSSGSISFNDFSITMVDQQVLAYYTIRTFVLNMGNDRREVKQFHYTSWPDFGVPDHPNPIISFIRRVNIFNRCTDGPDIIHCSAGVGRTGTYITIQSMLQMIEEEDKVDVFNFVMGMRQERNLMVQTEAQYIFIHDTIVELLHVGNTEMSIQRVQKELKILTDRSEDEVSPLERQFDELNSFDIPIPSNYVSAVLPINKQKNRFPDILPYEPYRVRLLMQPGVMGSDYINACYVDGYLRRNQFILTQGPLQHTVNDFWRMIWEHRASAIVMLCSLEERGKEQSARYWPTDKMTQYGDMFVETLKETDNGFYTVREMQITHTKQNNDIRNLKHFHFTEWSEDKCPDSSTSLLDMISLVQKAHHLYGGGPVVVHDSSSIGRAGTFCVMNIVIERLKVEGMVDVFFTIHSMRRKHPGIVATFDQYLFCFNTVRDYLDSFDKYSNFD